MSRHKSSFSLHNVFFVLWDMIGWILTPALMFYSLWRKMKGKELPGRLKERFGLLSSYQRGFLSRNSGNRLWIHGASVGETLSSFPLIDALLELDETLVIILTTTTITGYQIARTHPAYKTRLIHAFLPYDIPLGRMLFFRHWNPAGSVFIESDVWPGIIKECARQNIPFMLVNARLSDQSVQKWSHFKKIFQISLSPARWVIPRDLHDQKQFQKLGIKTLKPIGDLKEDAPPLQADPTQLALLKKKIGDRPVFIAVSTHEGEEEILVAALRQACQKCPTLLGIIVPRHPERGTGLALRFNALRRSLGEVPTLSDSLWIIDTLGEMGLFLNLAQSAFIGKSLCPPGGGHNPFEPLKAGCRLACGPYMSNWTEACNRLHKCLTVIYQKDDLVKWLIDYQTGPFYYSYENKNTSFSFACLIITTIHT